MSPYFRKNMPASLMAYVYKNAVPAVLSSSTPPLLVYRSDLVRHNYEQMAVGIIWSVHGTVAEPTQGGDAGDTRFPCAQTICIAVL